ncbi:MAG TPA: type II toxin-antitoxin system PemK/MazF family toxin [Actinomycetota bacterium]|nr:type II toxin-antitoxin system PemK/MazF family toxin [Actinomycetota bacterium]
MSDPARGEVWWGEAPDAKGRPYLVLTRDEAIPVLRSVLVAPVTRGIRGIPTEVPLGPEEGLPADGVASLDNVLAFPKSMLVRRMGALATERRSEPCEALSAATDC